MRIESWTNHNSPIHRKAMSSCLYHLPYAYVNVCTRWLDCHAIIGLQVAADNRLSVRPSVHSGSPFPLTLALSCLGAAAE